MIPTPGLRRRQLLALASASISIAAYPIDTLAAGQHDALSPTLRDAQWPTRPVRLVVGFPGGSSPDLTARTVAEPLGQALGQPVIVDNKPGASGNLAADIVAKSTDDHTLGIVINGNLTAAKLLNPKLPYDPSKDFAPVSLLTTAPLILVAPASLPGGAEFFVAARAAGSRWNYGSVGSGSLAHLGMELVKQRAPALQAVHIPYAGTPQIVSAMLAGDIQLALMAPSVALPHVRSGKLRAIGLTSGRSALAPGVAPLRDAGLPDLDLEVWNALVGPSRLSAAAQHRLASVVPALMRDADLRQKLFNQGWQVAGTSADGLAQRVRGDTAWLSRLVAQRGIRLD